MLAAIDRWMAFADLYSDRSLDGFCNFFGDRSLDGFCSFIQRLLAGWLLRFSPIDRRMAFAIYFGDGSPRMAFALYAAIDRW